MNGKPEGSAGPLRDKVAIVTGGGSGIGQATCIRLATEGAKIVVVELDPTKTETTCKELAALGAPDPLALNADVRVEEEMESMAREALERHGRIDILVHCAGILRKGGVPKMLAQLTTEEWDDVVATNLRGTFLANRAVLPTMIRQREGQIVNLSSTSGRVGRALDSAYCASKFGVIGLSESLAEEVRSYGIKVTAICPDAVDTPLWDQNGPIPVPEHALPPQRVADLIAYMLSLPQDTLLQNVILMPFKTRRRKKPSPGGAGSEGTGGERKT